MTPFAHTPKLLIFLFAGFVVLTPFGCQSSSERGDGGGSGAADGSGGLPIDVGTGGSLPDLKDAPPTPNCGDGKRDDDEACDDGNQESDDGCGGNCRYIEAGYICPEPGEPCRRFAKCGDGVAVLPEQCDDGNTDPDDGCSPTCKIEIGYKCSGSPSTCEETVCGDNVMEGAETCDDGNDIPFDGCSDRCQAEPLCTDKGCSSRCGDGLVMGDEECDDGNNVDGDGCSSDCEEETGYTCQQADPCEAIGDECGIRLPIVYRDFNQSHSDFQVGCDNHVTGIAQAMLNAAGKPALSSPAPGGTCIDSSNSFLEWYGARSGNYSTIVDSIVLFDNGAGGYVNRLNNAGDRYSRPPPDAGIHWCSDNLADGCAACAPGYTTCYVGCTPWGGDEDTRVCADYPGMADPIYIDGNPLFFPIDDHPDALSDSRSVADIPAEVYDGGWSADPSGAPRNFHFTSEIAYWFQYETGSTANLSFVGDDDVWVFVNRHLVVDLGGLHVPIQGSFTIDADGSVMRTPLPEGMPTETTVAALGLEDGGVYEIKVFHAERKTSGSSFRLTLSGFNTSRSECLADCGDGIIAAGEECDDGEENNVGGYNRCNADCTLSGYCGDGIKQEHEECDDADPEAPPDCRGCQVIVVR